MKLVFLAAWVSVLCLVPIASASEVVDAGVVVVQIHDNHPSECGATTIIGCAIIVTNAMDPGNSTIDMSQRVQYVGVATNLSHVTRGEIAVPVPDQSKTIRGDDVYVRQPFFRMMTEEYNSIPQDRPDRDAAGGIMDSTGFGVYYHGPSLLQPTGPSGNHTLGLAYDDPEYPPSYEQECPCTFPIHSDTDTNTHADGIPCIVAGPTACSAYGDLADRTIRGMTPDVVYGFEWENVQVATNPQSLHDPRTDVPRDPHAQKAAEGRRGGDINSSYERRDETHRPDAAGSDAPTPKRNPSPQSTSHVWSSGVTSAKPPLPPMASTAWEVIVAAAAAGAVLVLAVLARLYSRFHTKDALLKSQVRTKMLDIIKARPGLTVRDLIQEMSLARSTVLYHLSFLRKTQLVQVASVNGRDTIHPYGAAPRTAGVAGPVQAAICSMLEQHPEGCTRAELKRLLAGVPDRSRNDGIRRLITLSILHEEATPTGTRLRLAPR